MKELLILCTLLIQIFVSGGRELVVTSIKSGFLDSIGEMTTLAERTTEVLHFRFILCSSNETEARNINLNLKDGKEHTISYPSTVWGVPCLTNTTSRFASNATIRGERLGFVTLELEDQETNEVYLEYSVGVTRPPPQIQDRIYIYGIMVLVTLTTFTFGLGLDLKKVKEYLKKPIAPGIGMGCQFIVMPLVGFAITCAMTDAHPALKLGIFASAAAPGGGFSNAWIFVLNGDVDLSITMTFLSNIAALAVMPLWMYTLGEYILGGTGISLPFTNILQSLALLVVPLSIGILLNLFLPKVAKKLKLIQKPCIGTIIVFALVMSFWTNLYAFRMVLTDVRLTLCSFLLPFVGGILGFIIALACKQGKKLATTIGIETAIQNLNVVIVLLRLSLPQPWADISSAVPVSIMVFIFPPFLLLLTVKLIYMKFGRKKTETKDSKKMVVKTIELTGGVNNPAAIKDDEEE
ncbi:ileal sodium/bile acid cotransporter-like [Watersipora subatra]|uniref:ileal sodium/bile acid cotransporter-like n=1 Tax=Watersipora subatra TaxID=2589382 RepID=UPI00355B50A3